MPPLVEFELDYLTELGAAGGARRPYLWLEVTGPTGPSRSIRGLLDTGADTSSLPAQYAALLGHNPAQVVVGQGRQISGTFPSWTWPAPLSAYVTGRPDYVFELNPTFVPGSLNAVWGRSDFLRLWEFTLDEENQQLRLRSKVQVA